MELALLDRGNCFQATLKGSKPFPSQALLSDIDFQTGTALLASHLHFTLTAQLFMKNETTVGKHHQHHCPARSLRPSAVAPLQNLLLLVSVSSASIAILALPCIDFHYIYEKFGLETYGGKNIELFTQLVDCLDAYKEADPESNTAYQLYDGDGCPLIVAIVTPLMKRGHEYVQQSGELILVDSTSNTEDHTRKVFHFLPTMWEVHCLLHCYQRQMKRKVH